MTLGLSEAQLAERRLRMHAGDAEAIMAGDYRKVWSRFQPGYVDDDLSGEFRVQLGTFTEPFNLAWTARLCDRAIDYYSANALMRQIWNELRPPHCMPAIEKELVVCERYPFMAANLDAMMRTPEGHAAVLDAKHVGRSGETEILRYTPAGVWQATCAGTDWWGLSIICGNKWESPIFQEVDPLYQAEMIARAKICWSYVVEDTEPPEFEAPILAPKPTPKLRSIVVPTDNEEVFEALCRQNNWLYTACSDHIRAIVGTDAAAKVNAIHKAEMKALVPADVGELKYGRYRFARSKADAITQTVAKLPEEDDATA